MNIIVILLMANETVAADTTTTTIITQTILNQIEYNVKGFPSLPFCSCKVV